VVRDVMLYPFVLYPDLASSCMPLCINQSCSQHVAKCAVPATIGSSRRQPCPMSCVANSFGGLLADVSTCHKSIGP